MPRHDIDPAIVELIDVTGSFEPVGDHIFDVPGPRASLNERAQPESDEVTLLDNRMSKLACLARMPEKQIVAHLRNATTPIACLYIADYDRKFRKREQRRRIAENEGRKAERARLRAEPRRKIEEEGKHRLRILVRAIKYRRGDKLLEQLVGRESELVNFWIAMQLAAKQKGSVRSDQLIADTFAGLANAACSRHQARSRRKLVEQLERHPGVWQLSVASKSENTSSDLDIPYQFVRRSFDRV